MAQTRADKLQASAIISITVTGPAAQFVRPNKPTPSAKDDFNCYLSEWQSLVTPWTGVTSEIRGVGVVTREGT